MAFHPEPEPESEPSEISTAPHPWLRVGELMAGPIPCSPVADRGGGRKVQYDATPIAYRYMRMYLVCIGRYWYLKLKGPSHLNIRIELR